MRKKVIIPIIELMDDNQSVTLKRILPQNHYQFCFQIKFPQIEKLPCLFLEIIFFLS